MTIKRQITLFFLLIFAVVIISTAFAIRFYADQLFLTEFKHQAITVANTFGSLAKRGLITGHYTNVVIQAEAMAEHENLLYVSLASPDGVIRAHNDPEVIGTQADSLAFRHAAEGQIFVKETASSDGTWYYQVAVPVIIEGKVFGVAEIGYDLSCIETMKRHLDTFMALFSLAGLMCGIIVTLHFTDRITAPLIRLRQAAYEFTRGRFDTQLSLPEAHDEVGELSSAFSKMASVLKRTITSLKNSYLFLNRIITTISDIIIVVDEEGRIAKLNPAAVEAIGMESASEIKKSMRLPDLFMCKTCFKLPLTREQGFKGVECYMIGKDGPLPVLCSLSFLTSKNGRDLFVVTGKVIKELKEQAARLEKEHERMSAILESLGEGVAVLNAKGRIVLANRELCRMCGLEKAKIEGRPVGEVLRLRPEESDEPLTPSPEELRRLEGKSLLLTTAAGDDRTVIIRCTPVSMDHEYDGMVVAVSDITENIRLERELVRAQKMESLSLMAAGIAHDFNNILMGLQGYVNLIQLACQREDKDTVKKYLDRADSALDQAKQLSNQLLTFAKGGSPLKEAVRLDELLVNTVRFLIRGTSVKAQFDVAPDLWPVEADYSQMSQVINNLIINAIQAMGEAGGNLRVAARNLELTEARRPLSPGRYVVMEIEDDGCGIPRRHLASIFDPYFTTKEDGSGLGLAVVHSVVTRHGGHIEVDSEQGRGTCFTLYLPAAEAKEEKARPETGPNAGSGPKRGGRVLILDDEAMVREVLSAIMESLGFEAVAVAEGEEMLTLYREAKERGEPFTLVISDITLPGQRSGIEYARELLDLDPNAVIVAITGYTDAPVISEPARFGFRASIPKPFNIESLSRTIAAVMAEVDQVG